MGCWDWQWAFGLVGYVTDSKGYSPSRTYRVYRKSSPPKPGDLDDKPKSGANENLIPAVGLAKELKDSGERRSFSTGSVRDAAKGKGCPHLLPFRAIELVSKQMERGKEKYGSRNWELGQPLSSYFDSAWRHLTKHQLGWTDEPHLDAFVWNALAYAETCERVRLGILPKELDDRPQIGKATEAEMGIASSKAL